MRKVKNQWTTIVSTFDKLSPTDVQVYLKVKETGTERDENSKFEAHLRKTSKVASVASEDSVLPGHPLKSLILNS